MAWRRQKQLVKTANLIRTFDCPDILQFVFQFFLCFSFKLNHAKNTSRCCFGLCPVFLIRNYFNMCVTTKKVLFRDNVQKRIVLLTVSFPIGFFFIALFIKKSQLTIPHYFGSFHTQLTIPLYFHTNFSIFFKIWLRFQ